MLIEPRKSSSETFIVWNEYINLVGAFIPSNTGRASVCGTIRFKNGKKLSFSSTSDDCIILHQKIMFICQFIAKIYGTNVIHRKDCSADFENETSVLLKKESHFLN
jgi:hypothetical protein